jgi:hypothetical protein
MIQILNRLTRTLMTRIPNHLILIPLIQSLNPRHPHQTNQTLLTRTLKTRTLKTRTLNYRHRSRMILSQMIQLPTHSQWRPC